MAIPPTVIKTDSIYLWPWLIGPVYRKKVLQNYYKLIQKWWALLLCIRVALDKAGRRLGGLFGCGAVVAGRVFYNGGS